MKYYLSSYRIGDRAELLPTLFPEDNKRIAYIPNAGDQWPDGERRTKTENTDLEQLRAVGLEVERLDLKDYFHKEKLLRETLSRFGGVFVRGGNCFVLRHAMRLSGFDTILLEHNANKDEFVYAGYSAGICVLSPSLLGIHLADVPDAKPYGGDSDIIWEGLGLVPYAFAPHYRSDHPEAEVMETVVAYYKEHSIPFKTISDGEVIIL